MARLVSYLRGGGGGGGGGGKNVGCFLIDQNASAQSIYFKNLIQRCFTYFFVSELTCLFLSCRQTWKESKAAANAPPAPKKPIRRPKPKKKKRRNNKNSW